MDRNGAKKLEVVRLYEVYKKQPELFVKSTYVEDAAFLRDFGIFIPGKEICPQGYLKLYASDFIVEEMPLNGEVSTIDMPQTPVPFPEKDPNNKNHRALFATLVKCNISTIEAINEMAEAIGCTTDHIRYAGLKDKNAVTSQSISFHNIPFEKVKSISSSHYFLKDLRFDKGSIEKGGLKGNRFTLFIRTPTDVDKESFLASEKRVNEKGFYNFYYLQRFGAPRFIAHRMGFDILRGKYEEAVRVYLSMASPNEIPYFVNIRKLIGTTMPDWKAVKSAIGPYPLIMFNENKIVDYLLQHPEDHLGALKTVPDQVMLWVYAFGSLLFNEALSTYIKTAAPVPEKIPLVMSNQKEDIDFYAHFLKSIKFYPPQFINIRPFQNIILQNRMVQTIEKAPVEKISFSPEGMTMRFSLNKGQYATTLLSHMINLISGQPPENLSNDVVDTSSSLGFDANARTLDFFKKINTSKKDSAFEEMDQN